MEHTIILHLGSNMGDRKQNLWIGFRGIDQNIGKIVSASKIYNTEPWGKEDQEDYLNAAVQLTSDLPPEEVLKQSREIEMEAGSTEKEKWGKRILDIDLLFYDDRVIQEENLKVPHPFVHKRNFVLVPLMDIIPFYRHPQLNRTIEELYLSCRDPLKVEYFDEPYDGERGNA